MKSFVWLYLDAIAAALDGLKVKSEAWANRKA